METYDLYSAIDSGTTVHNTAGRPVESLVEAYLEVEPCVYSIRCISRDGKIMDVSLWGSTWLVFIEK